MRRGSESVAAKDVCSYIERIGGVLDRQAGSHRQYRVRTGATSSAMITVPYTISTNVLTDIARALGLTRHELLARMGIATAKNGRVRHTAQTTRTVPKATRADAMRVSSELRSALDALDCELRTGQRDAQAYVEAHQRCVAALRALTAGRPGSSA